MTRRKFVGDRPSERVATSFAADEQEIPKVKAQVYRTWRNAIRLGGTVACIAFSMIALLYISRRGGFLMISATTTTTTMNSIDPSDSGIIHIIYSRFMQTQPHLVDLGLARLELLKAFSLPSLLIQSSQSYIWVIATDPELNETLKKPLLEALKQHDHHLLIASNSNPKLNLDSLENFTMNHPELVWSGDIQKARSYLFPSSPTRKGTPRRILESRLDADDAVHRNFVMTLHRRAEYFFHPESWRIWCAKDNLDWQHHAVWENGKNDTSPMGALFRMNAEDSNFCMTAGLTVAYTREIHTEDDLPAMKHHKLGSILDDCSRDQKGCLEFLSLSPTALRARTPTSAGMALVMLNDEQQMDSGSRRYLRKLREYQRKQEKLWGIAGHFFGFTPEHATKVHSYLEKNMRAIAKDNLEGQCTKGHSCKDSAKALLTKIVEGPEAVI